MDKDKDKDTGGPAFPNPALADESFHAPYDMSGMTLRDWFAGQVLPHVYTSCIGISPDVGRTWRQTVAREAYELADAMIEARK